MSARALTFAGLSGIALLLVEVIAAFLVTPTLLRGLGAARYGAWDIAIGLVGYFGILDLGMSAAILRYVAHADGANARRSSHAYLATGFWSLASIGALCATAAVALYWLLPEAYGASSTDFTHLPALVAVVATTVALTLPMSALSAFLLGKQKNVGLNAFRTTLVVARAAVTVWAVTAAPEPDRLLVLAESHLGLLVIEVSFLWAWVAKSEGLSAFRPGQWSFAHARELLHYGLNSTLLALGTGSLRRVVGIVIARTAGLSQVAHYSLASRLVDYGQSFSIAIGYPLTAHLSRVAGTSDHAALQSTYLQSTRLIQFFSLGVPVGIFWMGEPFLRRWLGGDIAEHAAVPLAVLTIALAVQGLASNSNRALFAMAKHQGVAIFSALSAPLLIIVCVFLTRQFGIAGAAASIGLHGLANALYEIKSAERALGLRLTDTLTYTAKPYAVPLALMSVSLYFLKQYQYPSTYPHILGYCLAATAVYVGAVSGLVYREAPVALVKRLLAR